MNSRFMVIPQTKWKFLSVLDYMPKAVGVRWVEMMIINKRSDNDVLVWMALGLGPHILIVPLVNGILYK